ncbi:hypothetical protein GCM10022206_56530 [Streptomyces chiangmaiensis]
MPECGRTRHDRDESEGRTTGAGTVAPVTTGSASESGGSLAPGAAPRRTGLLVTLVLGGFTATPPPARDMWQHAGSASALLGAFPFLIGAVASPLVGIAGAHTAVPTAVVQAAAALVAVACFVGLCRPWNEGATLAGGREAESPGEDS